MTSFSFDATTVAPNTGPDAIDPGKYTFMITGFEEKATSDRTGKRAIWTCTVQGGPFNGRKIQAGFNVHLPGKENAQAIAWGQLSALCHVVGVLRFQNGQQLCGKTFIGNVTQRPNSERPGQFFSEISDFFDMQGNPPGQTGGVQNGGGAAGGTGAAPSWVDPNAGNGGNGGAGQNNGGNQQQFQQNNGQNFNGGGNGGGGFDPNAQNFNGNGGANNGQNFQQNNGGNNGQNFNGNGGGNGGTFDPNAGQNFQQNNGQNFQQNNGQNFNGNGGGNGGQNFQQNNGGGNGNGGQPQNNGGGFGQMNGGGGQGGTSDGTPSWANNMGQ